MTSDDACTMWGRILGHPEFQELVPQDSRLNFFRGFITLNKRQYRISISCPKGPTKFKGASIKVDPLLKSMIEEYSSILKTLTESSPNLETFLLEFKDFIDRVSFSMPKLLNLNTNDRRGANETLNRDLLPASYYRRVMWELEKIPSYEIQLISDDLQRINFAIMDRGERQHKLEVILPNTYPKEKPQCFAQLPVRFEFPWIPDDQRFHMGAIVQHFKKLVDQLQDLFDCLQDFDLHTWILEPEYPTHVDKYRRVVLSPLCSMEVEFSQVYDVYKSIPDYKFYGPEKLVAPYRAELNKHLDQWDPSKTPRANLASIMRTEFPRPDESDGTKNEMSIECAICYAYKLEGEGAPSEVCQESNCGKLFHQSCLFDWLKALPDTRQTYSTLMGQCPYCFGTLSMKVP